LVDLAAEACFDSRRTTDRYGTGANQHNSIQIGADLYQCVGDYKTPNHFSGIIENLTFKYLKRKLTSWMIIATTGITRLEVTTEERPMSAWA